MINWHISDKLGICEADRKGRQTILGFAVPFTCESHLLIADYVLWNLKRNVETIGAHFWKKMEEL